MSDRPTREQVETIKQKWAENAATRSAQDAVWLALAYLALLDEHERLMGAMRVIHKGLRDDQHGEFWTARKWLQDRDIFEGDITGLRVLKLVAETVLPKE